MALSTSEQQPSSATVSRLLRELKEYANNPNEALLHLGPTREDDLLHWEAVLKGVKGTPYEGEPPASYVMRTELIACHWHFHPFLSV
jgi:ubiquitin-protein ligase